MPSEQHKPHDPAILIWVLVGGTPTRYAFAVRGASTLASFLTRLFTLRRMRLIGLRSRGSRRQTSCLGRTRSEFCTRQSQPKGPLRRPTGPNANESPSRGWLWGGARHRRWCFIAVADATLYATNPRWQGLIKKPLWLVRPCLLQSRLVKLSASCHAHLGMPYGDGQPSGV